MAAQAPTTPVTAFEQACADLRRETQRQRDMLAALQERRAC